MIAPAHQRPAPAATALAALALLLIAVPLLALSLRVPWGEVGTVLAQPDTIDLLKVTIFSTVQATAIAVPLGVAAALWLNALRAGTMSTLILRLLMYLPLALPPVVGGLALSAAFGATGLATPVLNALGQDFAFTFPAVVLSHVFIALPFVIVTMDAAIGRLPRTVEASASGVGMGRGAILWRITLPALAPAIGSSVGLAAARSLGEFGTTLTFAGSYPGVTRTLPIGVYLTREFNPDHAYVLAVLLILLAVAAILLTLAPQGVRALVRRRRSLRTPVTPGAVVLPPIKTDAVARVLSALHILPESDAGRGPAVEIRATDKDGAPWTARFPGGQTTAIIGDNGAGKTTLAQLITGGWTGARVSFEGDAARGQRPGVILLTQDPGLPSTTTALKAVAMVSGNADEARQLFRAAGLSDMADTPVPLLSGGQAAQVALLRALAARPRVLILDEPLAAVDHASAGRWRAIFQQLRGLTVLLISHDPADIATLADSVAVMEKGRVVSVDSVEQALACPATEFAASMMGLNRVIGRVVGHVDGGADGGMDGRVISDGDEFVAVRVPGGKAGGSVRFVGVPSPGTSGSSETYSDKTCSGETSPTGTVIFAASAVSITRGQSSVPDSPAAPGSSAVNSNPADSTPPVNTLPGVVQYLDTDARTGHSVVSIALLPTGVEGAESTEKPQGTEGAHMPQQPTVIRALVSLHTLTELSLAPGDAVTARIAATAVTIR
ncbi:ATP-binding cassette domain-containing protein [Corynebacterium sp. zg254]|uniref:ATP-binding cassette domain-containing protein n=1 Tax=Corynebacterium zhongnanshanii TaxID=2768834 RepID=A0ABQ6VFD3_9CORY|nr:MULTISPECIES: ATP-binding cassette domain-containing protein [Corynebacterium]KAB3523121.1 ATP-binding cassette domain-containing protein [Corynebacterium zhongnanshanii]MCR5913776.1 ATP-binding cassette domain-containing protein [Corynebacterium sp. zg254]